MFIIMGDVCIKNYLIPQYPWVMVIIYPITLVCKVIRYKRLWIARGGCLPPEGDACLPACLAVQGNMD